MTLQVRFDPADDAHQAAISALMHYCGRMLWYFVIINDCKFVFRKGDYSGPADQFGWNLIEGVLSEAELVIEGAVNDEP